MDSAKPVTLIAIQQASTTYSTATTRQAYALTNGRALGSSLTVQVSMLLAVHRTLLLSASKLHSLASSNIASSSYFLSTTTGQPVLNAVCASLIGTDLTNVFQTSTLAAGPLPISHPLKTISKADIPANRNTVWADVIQIQWQSSNTKVVQLMASTASAAAMSSSAAPASKTSSIPPPTSTSDSSATSSSSGLSTGAKAGIGVGIALGVIALAIAAFLLFRYRRKKRPNQYREDYATDDYKRPGYHELAQNELGQAAPAEMDARKVNELPGTVLRMELDAQEPDRDEDSLSTTEPTLRHSQRPTASR